MLYDVQKQVLLYLPVLAFVSESCYVAQLASAVVLRLLASMSPLPFTLFLMLEPTGKAFSL